MSQPWETPTRLSRQDQIFESALIFIQSRIQQHLGEGGEEYLAVNCALKLMTEWGITEDTAKEVSAKALAETVSDGDIQVDIDRSTSHCLVLRHRNGEVTAVTTRKLFELLQHQTQLAVSPARRAIAS